MTYTFVKANGGEVGGSICEPDFLDTARNIEKLAKEKGVNLIMATDVVAADDFSENANTKILPANEIPEGWQGLDAGPESIAKFKEVIENSATILWNGPVGVFEMDKFAEGSKAVGEAIVKATEKGAFSLVGGGDSVACVNKFKLADGVSYISTAGGALLEYLEGRVLPGVAAVRGE
jgi:phosphoglycerate kinase